MRRRINGERCGNHPNRTAQWKHLEEGWALCEVCTLLAIKVEHERIKSALALIPDPGQGRITPTTERGVDETRY